MSNKEIKEKLAEIFGDLIDRVKSNMEDILDNAANEPAKISIEKNENGQAHLSVEGSRLGLLLTLAALEKTVLKKLECNNEEFSYLKRQVDCMEGDDNE